MITEASSQGEMSESNPIFSSDDSSTRSDLAMHSPELGVIKGVQIKVRHMNASITLPYRPELSTTDASSSFLP